MPKVSVIIPTYNREQLVTRAVQSVLNQTFEDFEVIVVDDNSNDKTIGAVEKFGDSRIRIIRHAENRGGSAARNTGIEAATGEFIGLLDDDDLWLPEKLEKQVAAFEKAREKVGLIYSGSELRKIEGDELVRVHTPNVRGNVRERLLLGPAVCGLHTVFVRRECFSKVGMFDETLKSCQDWDMWKRISEDYEFDYVPEILSRTYLHDGQISSDFSSMIPGRTRMVEKHREEIKRYPKIYVVHLKRLGKMHCLNGTWKAAVHWFTGALKVNPMEAVKIIAWLLLVLPMLKLFPGNNEFKKYRPDKS